MEITLAPCALTPCSVQPDLVLDLSGLTAEKIRDIIAEWTEENNIDEWAVSEFDDAFVPVLDSTDPEVWAEWEAAFEEHGDAILKFWEELLGFKYYKEVAHVLEGFESAYQGEYPTNEDWAVEYINDCYTLEGPLKAYFDYEKYARDCELGGDMIFIDADNDNVFAFNHNFFHARCMPSRAQPWRARGF